jgi:hypothetical protein
MMTNLLLMLSLACTVASAPPPVHWLPPGEVRVIAVDRECMAPLQGLTVTLHREGEPAARDARTVSGTDGRAHFEKVPAGEYTLSLEMSGFSTMSFGPFVVRADEKDNPQIPEFLAVVNPQMWVDSVEVTK